MGNSYTRQSSFSDGDTINSGLFNDEYDQLVAAFSSTAGHTHDGSTGEGAPITKLGPAQDVLIAGTSILPKTNNAIDLGSSTYKFKNAYFAGNITADGSITYNGNVVLGSDAADTVTINGTIQGSSLLFEGATANAHELTLAIPDVTSDVTITLPDSTQTLVGKSTTDTLTNKTLTSAVLNSSISGTSIKDEDTMSSNSASHLATQQSIKAYVDAQVTAQDLDFQGDSGGALNIDLDSETLTVAGGTGLASVGSGNTVTINIDSTVTTLTGSQTLTNKILTSPDINSPDIDGGNIDGATIATSNVTVGSGKTLNVSAGTLTTSSTQKKTIIEGAASNVDIGAYELRAKTLEADVATGTAPLTVASTTKVTNLNADKLDGADLDTTTTLGTSDTKIPSQKAVKTYVDAQVDTADTLSELNDTTISSVADNEVLAYNNATTKWINQTAAEAGLATTTNLSTHTGSTTNPHSVTATQVGLGNVDNESKATMFTNAALTSTPTAPTATAGTNTTQIATTAFVTSAVTSEDTLAEMNDTSITSPADSHFLVHNGSNWVNETGATARTSLGVDASGTDNSTNVTLSGTRNYLTIAGQVITLSQIDISDDTNLSAGTGITLTGDSLSVDYGTTSSTACIGNDSRLSNSRKCNNTFDSATTSRTNLGLGTAATSASSDFDAAGEAVAMSIALG